MKNKNRWLIVQNKATYLFLVFTGICVLFLLSDAYITFTGSSQNIGGFIERAGICILLAVISTSLFVKFNTYSHWMNPNHPKPKE